MTLTKANIVEEVAKQNGYSKEPIFRNDRYPTENHEENP